MEGKNNMFAQWFIGVVSVYTARRQSQEYHPRCRWLTPAEPGTVFADCWRARRLSLSFQNAFSFIILVRRQLFVGSTMGDA